MSKDRIYKRDFDKIIKRTLGISKGERAYLDEVFKNNLNSGLTVAGLKIKIDELLFSKKNIVSHWKLGKIRENIIANLTEKAKPEPKK